MFGAITSSDRHALAAAPGLSRIDRAGILLLAGVLAAYSICLLPVARGQYGALLEALHAFFLVGIFMTAVIALLDVACRKLIGNRAAFAPSDAAWYGLAAILTGTTIPIFGIFKQLILPARGFPLDPYLAALGRAICFGHDPWMLTHAVIGVVPTALIDLLYSGWMALMFLFPGLAVALVPARQTRIRLILCWLGVWIVIGSGAAWLLASAGPALYDAAVAPDASFHALNADLARIAAEAQSLGFRLGATEFQQRLLDQMQGGGYRAAGGISAMPSVHVSMAALFAIAGFQASRRLGYVMTVLGVVIWIGSIHLGWHYASDGIVGTVMVWLLWRGSAPVVRWATRRAAGRSIRPGGVVEVELGGRAGAPVVELGATGEPQAAVRRGAEQGLA